MSIGNSMKGALTGAFNGVSALSAAAVFAGAAGMAPLLTNGGISPNGIIQTIGMAGIFGSPFIGAVLAFPAAVSLFNPQRSPLSKAFSGAAAAAGGGSFLILLGATGSGALGLFMFTPILMMAAGVLNIAAELTKGPGRVRTPDSKPFGPKGPEDRI